MSIKAIARTYIEKIRPRAQAELDYFREQPSLELAIERAALAIKKKIKDSRTNGDSGGLLLNRRDRFC